LVSNCFATGDVFSVDDEAGGLIGTLSSLAEVMDTYATGVVRGNTNAGGLVGNASSSTIDRSYATGAVLAIINAAGAGGLVGEIPSPTGTQEVNDSFATGAVTQTVGAAGGLVGIDDDDSTLFVNDFWFENPGDDAVLCVGTDAGVVAPECTSVALVGGDITEDITDDITYFHDPTNEPILSWDIDVPFSAWESLPADFPILSCPDTWEDSPILDCATWDDAQ